MFASVSISTQKFKRVFLKTAVFKSGNDGSWRLTQLSTCNLPVTLYNKSYVDFLVVIVNFFINIYYSVLRFKIESFSQE